MKVEGCSKEQRRYIPLSVPNMSESEMQYAQDAIRTGWVSSVGAYVNRFEKELAEYVGTPDAVACQSGTAGLHLALVALGVGQGDLVIVPTLTFIAAVNPVRYVGADPVFMDCDDSLCIDPEKLRDFCKFCCYLQDDILYHKDTKRRVPAMILVHVFGNMADMRPIIQIAEEFHIQIVEDATEALGTSYTDGCMRDRKAGTIGNIGVYSFNGNKIITTGGGGVVVSHDIGLLARVRHLSTQAKSDELYFLHDEIGYNFRMTNVQAAIGVAQLERLEEFIDIKNENFILYNTLLEETKGITIIPNQGKIRSNHWMYGICLTNGKVRDFMIQSLEKDGIQTRPVWGLIHEQKPYQGALVYKIEKAQYYAERLLNVPCSTGLTADEVGFVAERITHHLEKWQSCRGS